MRNTLLITCLAASALSQAALWDNTANWTNTTHRSQGNNPALHITNTTGSAVGVSHVAFQGQNMVDQNIKFFLADSGGSILDEVTVFRSATGAHVLTGADVNWSLAAGQSYFIGAACETSGNDYDYSTSGFHLENGLQSSDNGNFNGYGSLTQGGGGAADMSWQLDSVPEPTTMALGGLALAGFLARRRKS
ncbi:MAG: PEP-CTERM sorting domain-containing protein [Fimbriimonadaceae bacterium]|nr:PEP-CTERM sorting domain-containing protein [Fimbriimonadaceae bacterium]